jgi:hypothetical protein
MVPGGILIAVRIFPTRKQLQDSAALLDLQDRRLRIRGKDNPVRLGSKPYTTRVPLGRITSPVLERLGFSRLPGPGRRPGFPLQTDWLVIVMGSF